MLQGSEAKICAVRLGNAGGIVVAHKDGQGIVGSDLPAVLPLLRRNSNGSHCGLPSGFPVGFLDADEMAVVTEEGVQYQDLEGNSLTKVLRTVSPEDVIVDKGGRRHFMLKEILEQPQSVASALAGRVDFEAGQVALPELAEIEDRLRDIQRVVLIGCGTSMHAAMNPDVTWWRD